MVKEGLIKEGSLLSHRSSIPNNGSKSSRGVPLQMIQNNLAPRGQTASNNVRPRPGRSMGVAIAKE